jgi:hypothetical protein
MNTYTCINSYNPAVIHSHCEDWGFSQCEYCEWYQAGNGSPHYPLPILRQVKVRDPNWYNNLVVVKINALNHKLWRWYWYLCGFNYGR